MSSDNGSNPMRWDCSKQGCFNVVKRPKIEIFADCLPGKIAFSDIDGITEVGGRLLVLEWKSNRRIPRGQSLLYERWTRKGQAAVIIIVGDAETMAVEAIAIAFDGVIGEWQEATTDDLRTHIRQWSEWARTGGPV